MTTTMPGGTASEAPSSSSSLPKKQRKHQYRSLGMLLRYFEGCPLRVELKTGHIYRGTLQASDDAMNVMLEDAVLLDRGGASSSSPSSSTSSSKYRRSAPAAAPRSSRDSNCEAAERNDPPVDRRGVGGNLWSMLQIRGSTIRYVHFDDLDFHTTLRQGLEAERAASRHYQRRSLTVRPPRTEGVSSPATHAEAASHSD